MTEIEMSAIDSTPETGTNAFDPSRYLRKLGGKDYLEVKWRLLWLREEHPQACVFTQMERLEGDFALFRAMVSLPDGGQATGWGSETKTDFFDFIEKAETKALGRALAALGYGTQFCNDHDFAAGSADGGAVVDSPVERPQGRGQPGSGPLATPAQLKLIYLTAERELHIPELDLEEICHAQYGRLPLHLTKREASEFIDALKSGSVTAMSVPAQIGKPPEPPTPPAAHDRPAPTAADAPPANGATGLVTNAQVDIINGLARQAGLYDKDGRDAFAKWHRLGEHTASLFGGKSVRGLTKAEGEQLIENLRALADAEAVNG